MCVVGTTSAFFKWWMVEKISAVPIRISYCVFLSLLEGVVLQHLLTLISLPLGPSYPVWQYIGDGWVRVSGQRFSEIGRLGGAACPSRRVGA